MQETPEKKTGEGAGVADPQATDTETSAPRLPIEAPAETEPAAGESETPAAAGQKGGQAPETNAAFARLRREAEEAKRALQQREAWIRERFGAQGIQTWEQYQAAVETTLRQQETDARKRRAEELREVGVDPAAIDDLIRSHPDVQALRQENELLRRRHEDENLVKQFNELTAEFPQIREPEDIDPQTWRKFNAARGNLTLLEAYVAAHGKDILAAARGDGEKAAVSRLASKGHLGTEKSAGKPAEEPDVSLTEEQLEVWRALGYSDKEARERERKHLKEQRKGGIK